MSSEFIGEWEEVNKDIECSCNAKCDKQIMKIPSNSSQDFQWWYDTDKLRAGLEGEQPFLCAMAEEGIYRAKINYEKIYPTKEIDIVTQTIYSNEFKIETKKSLSESEKVLLYAKDIYGEDIKFVDTKKWRAIEMSEVSVVHDREYLIKDTVKAEKKWLFLLPLEQDPYSFYYVGYGNNKGINFDGISSNEYGHLMNLSEKREEPKQGKTLTYIIFDSRGQNPQWDSTTYMYNPIGEIFAYNFEITKQVKGVGGHDREFSIYVDAQGDIVHHQVTAVLFVD